ncbi:hypothetical protein [Nostoc sp. WHI]|uniref:hypothetical protein n=1 Tax=Nostoc sp. WHI TaxID=2650611 RepID=UPI001E400C80|nr:hypothetical protein [Nostoc sp. WHI]
MSTASITEAVLAELGTPCDRVKLDISAGDTRKPDFLKVNPNGRVPAIAYRGAQRDRSTESKGGSRRLSQNS